MGIGNIFAQKTKRRDPMKKRLLGLACFLSSTAFALEYQTQFENDCICISKAKIMPDEEVGLHRDTLPCIVIALKGGTITRLEADGSETEVQFPTGEAVFRGVDPENELHRSVNRSSEAVELILIQMKDN